MADSVTRQNTTGEPHTVARLAQQAAPDNAARTLAAMCGADLEELLGELLLGFLVAAPSSAALVRDSDFHRRITLSHALGLISDDEQVDLLVIRDVREYLTQGPQDASFDDPAVVELCAGLRLPDRAPDVNGSSRADTFQAVAFRLLEQLWQRLADANRARRTSPSEIDPWQWRPEGPG